MEKKIYQSPIQLKEEGEPGEFAAVFSTFNVVDHQGDVTTPGAFTDGQKVRIAYWGHRWQDLPVGRGEIHADAEKAWVDGRFFLDTEAGRETYQTVKNLQELQEWSYGFDIDQAEDGEWEGKQVRVLKKLSVHEVSPVFLGAGIGTQTITIKSAGDSVIDGPEDGSEDEAAESSKASGLTPDVVLTLLKILEEGD